ncbi:helix-turn-helix transcriptional regulator [Comamonas sp. GB3 AK4-5]|uniref:helix-turn-helix transcriptional regulator n=1 Tax=Comamonas sp. GB3 AK4-5 TaxID=3231487 RepID=UPI00351E5D2E
MLNAHSTTELAADAHFSSLLSAVYAAGMSDVPWEAPLTYLRTHMGLRGVGLLSLDMQSGLPSGHVFAGDDQGWSTRFLAEYQQEYRLYDPTAAVVANWEPGRWFDDHHHISSEQRAHGVYHQQCMPSFEIGGFCGFFIQKGEQRSDYLSLLYGRGQASPSEEERRTLALLRTHLARALQLQSRLEPLEQKAALADAALNALDVPVFVMDEARVLLQVNAAGHALMRAHPMALRCVGGRLMPAGWSESAQWQQASKQGVLLLRGEAGESLPFTLYPMPPDTRLARHWQRPLTLMLGPDKPSPTTRVQQLRALYGLTQAEAELCVLLAFESLSQKECADFRQVSLNTVRTQVKAIEAKLGVSSMAEVTRMAFLQHRPSR